MGPQRVGGPKPKKSVVPNCGAPEGWALKGGGPKNSLFFFPLPPQFSLFFHSLGGVLVKPWWCLKRRDPQMCTFGVLGLSCEAPAAQKPSGCAATDCQPLYRGSTSHHWHKSLFCFVFHCFPCFFLFFFSFFLFNLFRFSPFVFVYPVRRTRSNLFCLNKKKVAAEGGAPKGGASKGSRRGSHDNLRTQTSTFEGPSLQKHHQNSTRTHPREGRKHEIVAGEGKKREFLRGPASG